jgi:hypothetical protein
MPEHFVVVTPEIAIPAHLVGEVGSKLAYVDELVGGARIAADGSQIRLELRRAVTPTEEQAVVAKTQRVVQLMAKGAIQPKVDVLEDHLARPVPCRSDPMPELLSARGGAPGSNRHLHPGTAGYPPGGLF